MKVERLTKPGQIWPWIKLNLAYSLVPMERVIGYGVSYFIYERANCPNLLARVFDGRGEPVAQVFGLEVHLYHPQYFSDFEDLCRRFEQETGYEPTLRYWEAPKVPA